jgi:hypothetical protein
MNQLLNDKKFGFNKFLGKCPCVGGGGGGARICKTPITQIKWVPDSTDPPTPPTPGAVTDGSGCKKVYSTPFNPQWEGDGPKEESTFESGEETCSPKGPLPPCKCGNEISTYTTEPETLPPYDPPEGTSESRNFGVTFSCDYVVQLNPGAGCVTAGNQGSYGVDHNLKATVSVAGKKFTRSWERIVTEIKDCVL